MHMSQLKKATEQRRRGTSGFVTDGPAPEPDLHQVPVLARPEAPGAPEAPEGGPDSPSGVLEAPEAPSMAFERTSAPAVASPASAAVVKQLQSPGKSGGPKASPLAGLLPMRAVIGTGRGEAMTKQSIAAERTIMKGADRAAKDAHMKISTFWAQILATPLPDGWWERTFVKYEQTPREFFELRHKAAGGRVQNTIMMSKSLKDALEREMKELKDLHGDFGPTSITQVVEAHALVWAMVTAGMDPNDI